MSLNIADHWNKVYATQPVESLGWYEENPSPSIDLISRCGLKADDLILDVGSGATSLMRYLIESGYRNLMALDISSEALERLRASIPVEHSQSVLFIQADIRSAEWVAEVGEVGLWHDRALLHFLTEASDREAYIDRLHALVRKDGSVVIGAFSLEGASHCSGLPIQQYSVDTITSLIGKDFQLEESADYEYVMPSGDKRPYVYARYRRVERE